MANRGRSPSRPGWLLNVLLLVLAGCLTVWRQPRLFSHPRFWAEEGTVFFSRALCTPWFWALLQPAPSGYLKVFNNLVSVLAAYLVPLELAPLVTTVAAFVVQMVPLVIVLTGASELHRGKLHQTLLILIVLLNVYTGEIWLNTTNSQNYILLTALLILVQDVRTGDRARNVVYAILLGFAGLNSPYVVALAPLFVVKWVAERKPAYKVQAILVVLCALVQAASALLAVRAVGDDRFGGFTWSLIPYVAWSRTLIYPIAGLRAADAFTSFALNLRGASYGLFLALGMAFLLALALLLVFLAWPLSRKRAWLTVAAFGLVLGFSIVTSATHGNKDVLISPRWSPRYFFVPSVLLLWVVLSNVRFGPGRLRKARAVACLVLVALSLYVGALSYSENLPYRPQWPDWRHQVSLYRRDPSYRDLQIWPPGWSVHVCDR